MKIKPLFDRVLLKPIQEEKQIKNGLVIPTSSAEHPSTAKVVAIGDGTKDVEMKVKIDDVVLYNAYAGNEYKLADDTYIIINQADILAKIEKE